MIKVRQKIFWWFHKLFQTDKYWASLLLEHENAKRRIEAHTQQHLNWLTLHSESCDVDMDNHYCAHEPKIDLEAILEKSF